MPWPVLPIIQNTLACSHPFIHSKIKYNASRPFRSESSWYHVHATLCSINKKTQTLFYFASSVTFLRVLARVFQKFNAC